MEYELIKRLEELPTHSILVVGDVMLDRFTYGQVDRISPEAPIPVMRYAREISMLGGAGNVVRNLVSLKQRCDLIAVVGADPAGFEVAKQLSQDEVVTPHLLTDQQRPTTIKTRFIAGIQQVLRCDVERAEPVSGIIEQQIEARLKLSIPQVSAVILSDYAKGVLTAKTISTCVELCKQHNKPVVIDPKGRDYSRYTGATVVTPNRKELAEATGREIKNVEDAVSAARMLMDKFKFGAVLAKLSADGVCLVTSDSEPLHIKATAREVFDVSGAGDTVIAAFVTALAAGLTMQQAAHMANEAGSIVVSKVGTATVTIDELITNLRQIEDRDINEKILPQNKAVEVVERWRRQGLSVGFTNGCFDLVHPGHISILQQSRKNCDRLVVGLNSDSSVKRLKGQDRPVQNEKARATVLATLNPVDLVVIFDEDTPMELIKALRPNVLVKGADYTIDKVVGAREVQSWGGRVVLADLVDGQSTTNTIKKLKSSSA